MDATRTIYRRNGDVICVGTQGVREMCEQHREELWNADLRNADLRNADLRGADLSGADLRNADLREANRRRADLSKAEIDIWRALGIFRQ